MASSISITVSPTRVSQSALLLPTRRALFSSSWARASSSFPKLCIFNNSRSPLTTPCSGKVRVTTEGPEESPLEIELEIEETQITGGGGDFGGGGGGGGGGGNNNSQEGEGGGEEGGKKKMAMSLSQKLTLIYAALVGAGGVMGYIKGGSQKSLASGGLSALLLLYVYSELPVRPTFASALGFGLSAALLTVMGSRFMKSKKLFPAGLVSFVSLIMAGGYLHGFMHSLRA
ncbi:uncharacterized protein LOC143881576 [Tasmannia lanceolata]|uniref:uncharacterized protein LOC143881576 n=1 Tax=Tasmannia lanceolata TaxID=3420 RepID=UPI004062AEF1